MPDATTTTTRQPIRIQDTTSTNKKVEYDEYEEETTSNSFLVSERINDQSETANVIWSDVIGQLAGDISKLESARDQINLIENVSKQVLENMPPDQKQDINQVKFQKKIQKKKFKKKISKIFKKNFQKKYFSKNFQKKISKKNFKKFSTKNFKNFHKF